MNSRERFRPLTIIAGVCGLLMGVRALYNIVVYVEYFNGYGSLISASEKAELLPSMINWILVGAGFLMGSFLILNRRHGILLVISSLIYASSYIVQTAIAFCSEGTGAGLAEVVKLIGTTGLPIMAIMALKKKDTSNAVTIIFSVISAALYCTGWILDTDPSLYGISVMVCSAFYIAGAGIYILSFRGREVPPVPAAAAPADKFTEIKRYKELLEQGIVTEEEFLKKKKDLLGL